MLVSDWNKVTFTSTSVTLTPSSNSFTHGTSITVSGSVTPASATGDVALMTDSTEPVQQGQPGFPLKNGSFSSNTVNYLPGGTYNIWGQYSGDGTNALSTSQKTQITVSPENSGIYFNLFSPAGNVSGVTNVDYGTQILLSAQVAPSSQLAALESCQTSSATCPVFGIPTGTVAFVDGSSTINTAVLNAEGDAEYNAPFALGPHSVAAKYAGDNSYNPSTATAVTFTVVQDTPVIGFGASNQINNSPPQFANGQSTVFNIQVLNGAAYNSATNTSVFPVPISPPTGTVTVTGLPGGTQTVTLSPTTDPTYLGREGVATVTVATTNTSGTYTVNVSYSGDSNYKATSTGAFQIQIGSLGLLATTTTATVVGNTISPSTNITITGTVTGQNGHGPPTNYFGGIGIFSSGNFITNIPLNVPATGDVSTFSATLNSQTLFQGANFVTLQYLGDQNYNLSAFTLNNGAAISNPLSDFSMVPETTIVPVTAGSQATDTINLSSVNSFAGAVSFTCTPASGISCTITPSATLSAGSTSPLTLTINASASVTNGSYNVLVTGKDSTGLYVHTLAIEAVASGGSTSPGFSLGAAPSSLSLVAGATTGNTSIVTVTPANGFTGNVGLTCAVTTSPSSPTSPATCSLSSSSVDVTSGAATSTVTVGSTSTTTPGTYTVTVTGTGSSASGPITETTAISVAISAPTFALSANPSSLTVTAGGTGTSTITVTPSGFTGTVNLACTASSAQVTCSVPASVSVTGGTPATAMLTVTAGANSGALRRPLDRFLAIGGGATLALLVFFGVPARRRSWRAILGIVLFGALVGIGIGCGGGGGGNSGGGGSASYTITVTGTATGVSPSPTTTVNVTVNQ